MKNAKLGLIAVAGCAGACVAVSVASAVVGGAAIGVGLGAALSGEAGWAAAIGIAALAGAVWLWRKEKARACCGSSVPLAEGATCNLPTRQNEADG